MARLPLLFHGLTIGIAALLGGCGTDPSEPPSAVSWKPVAGTQIAHQDAQFGVPSFVWLEPAATAPQSTAEDVAWQVVRQLAPTYRLNKEALTAARVRGVHDTGRGAIIVHFEQRVGEDDVFGMEMNVVLGRDLAPVASTGHLAPLVRPSDLTAVVSLDEAAAVASAARAMLSAPQASISAQRMTKDDGGHALYALAPIQASDGMHSAAAPARVRRTYFARPGGLTPAYYIELDMQQSDRPDSDMNSFVISAVDGSVLLRNNLVANDATYRVWADGAPGFLPWDGPHGNALTPYPLAAPDGRQLAYQASSLLTLLSAPFSKNDPWLPAGATQLSGNNAFAYADLSNKDGFGPGDLNVPNTAADTFDYALNLTTTDPAANQTAIRAVTTNLFYIVNFMHDYFYDSGYNEAARNPQQNNYGRGGVAGDPIHAESQDYSGRNNANASTPADGKSPRIQQYLWDPTRTLTINSPAGLAGTYQTGTADWGPTTFNVTKSVIIVDDGTAPTSDGCEVPFVNRTAISGNIALIDRGLCNFTQKVQNAQSAGAAGVVIVNNQPGAPTGLGGTPTVTITIPALMISQTDGGKIKAAIGAGMTVNATMLSIRANNDSSLDGSVVSHEWGHTMSNRLIGNGNGLTTNQAGGLGEGWSDFTALLTLVRPEDIMVAANANWNGTYAVGAYSAGPGNNVAYYGIRRYPYSSDMTKDPLTFKHIQEGVSLPINPAPQYGQDGVGNSEVHNTGEVWTTMLWECYAALLRDTGRYTFAKANQKMRDYLVASYKMTPLNPTLLQARDALLAAMYADDQQNFQLCTQAFARRGAGMGATGPVSTSPDNKPVTESYVGGVAFNISDITLDVTTSVCQSDGVFDSGESGRLTIKVSNTGSQPITLSGTVTASNPAVALASGAVSFPVISPFASGTATVDLTQQGAATDDSVTFTVALDATPAAIAGRTTITRTFRINYDIATGMAATDTMNDPSPVWTVGSDPTRDTSQPWRQDLQSGTWIGPGTGAASDQYLVSPPLNVGPSAFGFTLRHRYSFDDDPPGTPGPLFYDGGVIEISQDDGATWTDIGQSLTTGGYNGQIYAQSPVLPLRQGFVGDSTNYPAFVTTTASLGTAYAGKPVRLRFRIGTNDMGSAAGWELDQIDFTGITNTPFSIHAPNGSSTCNGAPVGDGGSPDGNQPTDGGSQATGCSCDLTRHGSGAASSVLAFGMFAALFLRRRRTVRA